MSEWPEYDLDDEEEEYTDVTCVCGSDEFYFVGYDNTIPIFTIDSDGLPLETNGHPRCAVCDLDYPIVGLDVESELPVVLMSDDLIDPESEEWDDLEEESDEE